MESSWELGNFDKIEWRARMAANRDSLEPELRRRNSEQLCRMVEKNILASLRRSADRPISLCLYAAFRSEADPAWLMENGWLAGDRIVAPRITKLPNGERGLELREVCSKNDFIPGKWGIPEPDPDRTKLIPDGDPLDVVLVPGLAFDRHGGRLGYGGGFYDRLQAAEAAKRRMGERTLWLGFSYSSQVTGERLPKEPHDLRLNGLLTEEDITWFEAVMGGFE